MYIKLLITGLMMFLMGTGLQAQDVKGEWVLDKVRVKIYDKVDNMLLEDRLTDSLPERTEKVLLMPHLYLRETEFQMQGEYLAAGTYSSTGKSIGFRPYNRTFGDEETDEDQICLPLEMPSADSLYIEWPVSIFRQNGRLVKRIVICQYKRKK